MGLRVSQPDYLYKPDYEPDYETTGVRHKTVLAQVQQRILLTSSFFFLS